MTEGNTQLTLHDESIEFVISSLTMFAHVSRAMNKHEKAERVETVRNTIQMQFYPKG